MSTGPSKLHREEPVRRSHGAERVAHVLLAAGQERAVAILRAFSEEEIRQVADAARHLAPIVASQLNETLRLFEEAMRSSPGFIGSEEEIQKLLSAAELKPPSLTYSPPPKPSVWDGIVAANAERFQSFIENQHPQVIAYVVSRLPAKNAAEAMDKLTTSQRKDILMRVMSLKDADSLAVEWLEESIASELLGTTAVTGRHGLVAEVLNLFEGAVSDEFIQHLEIERPADAKVVRRFLFRFDALASMPSKSLSVIADQIAPETLILALSGAEQSFQATILAFLPPRARRMTETELASGARHDPKVVAAARRSIVSLVLSLINSGAIEPPPAPSKATETAATPQ